MFRYVYVAFIGLFVIISFHPYRPVAPVYHLGREEENWPKIPKEMSAEGNEYIHPQVILENC